MGTYKTLVPQRVSECYKLHILDVYSVALIFWWDDYLQIYDCFTKHIDTI